MIYDDLCMRNIVHNCLDYKNPQEMSERANAILNYVFKKKANTLTMNLLMGLLVKVVNMDSPLKEYGRFFNSNRYNEQ